MESKIFILNGVGGSGKDSFVDFIAMHTRFETSEDSIRHISTITPIKEIAQRIGWDGLQKTAKDRKFLSDLKDLCTEYNDLSLNHIKTTIANAEKDIENSFPWEHKRLVFFIDCREPVEIQKLKSSFPNSKTIIIRRPEIGKHGNHADDNVGNFDYDIVIENDGTIEDLEVKAIAFYNLFIREKTK